MEAYTYDADAQHVAKDTVDAFGNITDVHYHYDQRSRLISDTDAVMRDYVWLGLMPVPKFGPDDGTGTPPPIFTPAH
ncbi:MAG: hypothetical protein AAF311_04305 [Pseudomonadota bacterium]